MSVVPEQFRLEFTPLAAREAMVQVGSTVRFTVLTERLIRLEYHPEGCFEDRASQAFWYRQQPVPLFDAQTTASGVEIETAYLHLKFAPQGNEGFTPGNLSIRLKLSDTIWQPGAVDEHNLRGTTRTLDYANGYVKLETGLMSRSGWSI
ncbi:MAG: alpha-xylosidase, partial [Anaerolineae bacterium]|nr:alpha-xylosidase [Anaerolineae bacterium]